MLFSYVFVLNVILVQSFPFLSDTIEFDDVFAPLDESSSSSNVNSPFQSFDDGNLLVSDAIEPSISSTIALQERPDLPPIPNDYNEYRKAPYMYYDQAVCGRTNKLTCCKNILPPNSLFLSPTDRTGCIYCKSKSLI